MLAALLVGVLVVTVATLYVGVTLMAALDDLTTAVTAAVAEMNAAVQKIQSAPADNSAQLTALTIQLQTATAALAAAVTPPAPPTT